MHEHDRTFGDYLRAELDQRHMTGADLSRASGVANSVISRWLSDETRPSLENVRLIAQNFGRPILEVVVAAGLLTAEEAKQQPPSASALSDDELIDEIRRRMGRGPRKMRRGEIEGDPERFVTAGRKGLRGVSSSDTPS
jgi:transcriptional regulator with XRE-family HTH domain